MSERAFDEASYVFGFIVGMVLGIGVTWLGWHLWSRSHIDTVEQIEKFKQEKIFDAHRLYRETLAREEQK